MAHLRLRAAHGVDVPVAQAQLHNPNLESAVARPPMATADALSYAAAVEELEVGEVVHCLDLHARLIRLLGAAYRLIRPVFLLLSLIGGE